MSLQRHDNSPIALPQTFAKAKGKEPFNWFEFLQRATAGKVEKYSAAHNNACSLSISWVTCACGNQCAALPRTAIGSPLDRGLCILGGYFATLIETCMWDRALRCLREIENRSHYLLTQ